ncbi:hypothetical protein EI77_00799 [Prosthecobacter fusiformis]|uniref:TPM domain-containing protein n=1 Tax=Prosthecobacter fusiformis TaxID=48464 RepID=A0A4R7SQH8_9BACT|nr:hypothetical protein [Prosthecobacter fusiformis]TDU81490.1 hypothetical protein EI77_00799 [Prosthecobacter fusiformis]
MIRLCTAFLFWTCLGFWATASAQDMPAAPANGLRDDTRALNEKIQAELAQDIATCREAIHADVWFNASTYVTAGQSLGLRARSLRQHWSPGKDAVLMTYDRASDSHALSFSPGLWQRYPSAEIISIIQRSLVTMADKTQPLETRLTLSLRQVLRKLQALEKQRHQSAITLSRHHLRLAQSFAIGLGAGALLLLLVGVVIRRRDTQAAWQSFFPKVQVGIRYGAPHGGGVIVEK